MNWKTWPEEIPANMKRVIACFEVEPYKPTIFPMYVKNGKCYQSYYEINMDKIKSFKWIYESELIDNATGENK